MIALLALGFGFVLGTLHGQGKLFPWVRGAAGKARGVVFGLRPAPIASHKTALSSDTDHLMGHSDPMGGPEVSPTPPKNPIRVGEALKNLLGFARGFLGFILRYWQPILFVIVALVVWNFANSVWRFASCPMGKPGLLWCVGQTDDSAALEMERINTQVAELEARVGALSGQLAENTARDQRRVDRIISQADQDITNAVEAVDPSELYSVYRRAYDSVWDDLAQGSADPAPSRPDRLPGAPANPV